MMATLYLLCLLKASTENRLFRSRGLLPRRLRFQDFVDQKKIREQRSEMDRSIQIVD
jgi:hypothetical protein